MAKPFIRTYCLKEPIYRETVNGETGDVDYEELKPAGFKVTFRRPKAKHMKIWDTHIGLGAVQMVLVACTNLDQDEVENLEGPDFLDLEVLWDKK